VDVMSPLRIDGPGPSDASRVLSTSGTPERDQGIRVSSGLMGLVVSLPLRP
jgi:hypothetical protein